MIKALLWDVDGTLAETERDGHRVAFNLAFEELGLPWRWDERRYGELLRVTGGRERLMSDMATRSDAPVGAHERRALANAVHGAKTAHFARIVQSRGLPLREGVAALVDEARAAGLAQGIVTTTSRANVEALLSAALGARWREAFDVVVCGEDVRAKKPDPEAYERALSVLGLSPLEAIALEDSPGGAAAARAAEVPVVVTRSHYFADDPVDAALAIGPGLHTRRGWRPALADTRTDADPGRVRLADLQAWHALADAVSSLS